MATHLHPEQYGVRNMLSKATYAESILKPFKLKDLELLRLVLHGAEVRIRPGISSEEKAISSLPLENSSGLHRPGNGRGQ